MCFSYFSSSFSFSLNLLRTVGIIFACIGLMAGPVSVAQTAHYSGTAGGVNLGSVKVGGTGSTATVSFTFDTGGELNATTPYQVVTQGAPKLDFADAGGSTCAAGITYKVGDTCSVKRPLRRSTWVLATGP